MITNTKINEWLANPQEVAQHRSHLLEQYAKEFPYFSIAQYLNCLKSDSTQWKNISLRYNIHPTLGYILRAKYKGEYKILFESYNCIKEENDSQEDSHSKTLHQNIEEDILNFAPPQQEYFKIEGIDISDNLPKDWNELSFRNKPEENPEQALMVVMPFSEWLKHLSKLSLKEKAEVESKKSLRALWQKEKLAIALEEETEEIPEEVFEMAVNSIAKQDDIVNESLADVYVRQEKYQKAIDIYIKLSLLYPEKNTYFASKIEKLKKEL